MVFKKPHGENTITDESCLASSFFYRIHTPFRSFGQFIRCCVLGDVPESCNRVVPIRKQESRTKKNELIHMAVTQQGNRLQVDKAVSKESKTENSDCVGNAEEVGNLKKLLTDKTQEEELHRLYSELEKKG